jgi:hypothetical protein
MRRQHRAVAGQREAQRFGEAVHRVRREHARARATGRAGRALDRLHFLVGIRIVGRRDHRIDQIERDLLALEHDLAGFHRPTGHEHRRNVEPHRRHQHAGRDLVAVGDAHHRVGAVRIDHILDAVGDQLSARQRIQHAAMAHGDAVIDRDGVEFLGDAPRRLDLACDQLAEILEVDVARHELREAVRHRDDRLAEVAVLHPRRAPQAASAGHVAAMGGGAGTVSGHDGTSYAEAAALRNLRTPVKGSVELNYARSRRVSGNPDNIDTTYRFICTHCIPARPRP